MDKKNIILTGSQGYLGILIQKELKNLNYNIIKIDNKKISFKEKDHYFKTNLNSEKEIKKTLNKIKKKYNKIDILINCAALQIFSDFEKRSFKEINEMFNVNLRSAIIFTQFVFLKYFKKLKKGHIVNISSIFGIRAPNFSNYKNGDRKSSETYGATKAGLIQITKYFANYMSPYNIRVNSISPGGIRNDKVQNKKFINRYSKLTPMKRMANPCEIINFLIFLISDKASYCNGQNFIIDGGYTVK
jgi:NAD(P)-dependent dehydrogenase (short-subunit alcohol dehydrogenase family)